MALLTDPDTLSQGTLTTVTDLAFTSTVGAVTVITSTANLPQLDAGAYFEIRNAADPNNNGLYRETGGTPTTSSITATKQGGEGGANPADDAAASTSFYAAVFTTYPTPTTGGVTITNLSSDNLSADFNATGGDTHPTVVEGNFISFQGFANSANNTVYKVGAAPTSTFLRLTAVDTTISLVAESNVTTAESVFTPKNVFFDVYNREIWLQKEGSLTDDGVTLQALYSFTKEEWKNDDDLIYHPFPFVAITPEQFEIQNNWAPYTGALGGQTGSAQETRKLIRTGGWREIAADGTLNQEHVGVITLGTFEDNVNDLAYFQQGNDPTDTTAATDFTFNGPVNEAVRSYYYMPSDLGTVTIASNNEITRGTGSWITDGYRVGGQITIVASDTAGDLGTYVITTLTATVLTVTGTPLTNEAVDNTAFRSAVNNRNVLNLFLRIRDGDTNGKTFDSSNLPAIGVTAVDNKVFRFPLANVTDLDITSTDAAITGGGPWDQILVRYFDGAFSRDVDSTSTTNENNRDFGIVIDVGTYSGIDGVSNGTTSFTTADAGIPGGAPGIFDGGTLTIHNAATAADNTSHAIASANGSASGGTVTLDSALTGSETGLSFTLQRSTPVLATTNEIYEKVQYLLRQDANINYHGDNTGASPVTGVVTGSTADALLRFVGTELESGQAIPTNPNGGGTGVIVEGFQETDFNRMTFFDNTATLRTFPFVASGTISFNTNLQDDPDAKYWMFFTYTERTDPTNDIVLTSNGDNTASIVVSTGAIDMPVLVVGEYIRLGQLDGVTKSFTNAVNNGIFRVTAVNTSQLDYDVAKVDVSDVLVTETADVTIDEDPIDSPDAIIVDNNDGNDISALISGAASVTFTFDYDNNAQGAREAGDGDAAVTLRAIGFNSAQFVETSGTIAASDANNFSLVAALERNYSNEA